MMMLCGVAATLVVLFNLQAAAVFKGNDPGILAWFQSSETGVDIVFVLSGFVIFHAVRGRGHLGPAGSCGSGSDGSCRPAGWCWRWTKGR